jgi:hypothetical protein
VHCLGILHYGWDWNLASMVDGTNIEAQAAAVGYAFVFWFRRSRQCPEFSVIQKRA